MKRRYFRFPTFIEFVLITDDSDLAVSVVLHQKVSGGLASISYYSRVLTAAERKYSTYEKVLSCHLWL